MTPSWKCIVVVHSIVVTKRIDHLPVPGCYRAWVTLTSLHDRKVFSLCSSFARCDLSWTMIESSNYWTLKHMVAQCMLLYFYYLNLLIELCYFLPVFHEHITAVSWHKQNKIKCLLKVREKDNVVVAQTVIHSHCISEKWMVQLICA